MSQRGTASTSEERLARLSLLACELNRFPILMLTREALGVGLFGVFALGVSFHLSVRLGDSDSLHALCARRILLRRLHSAWHSAIRIAYTICLICRLLAFL